MSDLEDNGGPAFPIIAGMSLRDWFAGQVICSIKGWHPADRRGYSAAEIAYRIADEMLEVRSRGIDHE